MQGSHFVAICDLFNLTNLSSPSLTVEATFIEGVTEEFAVRDVSDVFPQSTKSPEDPTMVFFTMDYGTIMNVSKDSSLCHLKRANV